jgi:hypothetical protein
MPVLPGLLGGAAPAGPNLNFQQDAENWANLLYPPEDVSPPKEKTKKARRKKPDLSTVLQRIDMAVTQWGPRNDRMDEDKRFYDLQVGEETDSGNLVVRNIPYTMVEKAARLVGNAKPRYDVIPPQNALRHQTQKIENFIRWQWKEWNRRWYNAGNVNLYHDMAHYLALRGWIAVRLQYNPEADTEELPVKLKLFDPRQVYPVWGDEALDYVALVYKQTVAQIVDAYPELESKYKDRDLTEQLDVKAYYDDWYWGVFVDDEEVLKVQAHEYGFCPFIIMIGGGSPIRSTDNDATDYVAGIGPSIFHGIKDAYLMLNTLMSQLADEIERQANPPLLFFWDPNSGKEPKRISFEPGSINHLFYDRERVEPLSLGPRPQEASPLMNMLIDDIEKGGLPNALWGMGQEGASGFQTSLAQGATKDALQNMITAMENAQTEVNRRALELIRDLHDSDVGFFLRDSSGGWVSGVTVSVEDIQQIGVYNTVTYPDVSPRDKIARANLAIPLVDKQVISREEARENWIELENPEREEERVIAEMIMMDERVMKEIVVPATLRRADPRLFQAWLISKERELMQPPQPPQGPPGAPPGPPGMPPGMPPAGPPGMPPGVVPPPMQPQAAGGGPMDLLAQALGSAAGGAGMQRPPGIPGGGALPVRLPLGM